MDKNHINAEATGKRLVVSMLINILIPAAQIVGGIYAGSMALISDAVHNISDFTALIIAYVAHLVAKSGPTQRHTFGLRRVEIFAAVINSALLGGTAVVIAVEAVDRLKYPMPVLTEIVAVLALVGIAGNGLSAWLLHKDSKHNLNLRGAFLHMLGDLMTSVAVLVGAIVLHFKPWPWIDPVLSLIITAYILLNCILLLKESIHVLMNGTPRGLDLNSVKDTMEAIPGVDSIHYLHAWSLGADSVALTCHVVVPDQPISTTESLSRALRKKLLNKFGVDHPVLQFETSTCGEGRLLCQMASNLNLACLGTR